MFGRLPTVLQDLILSFAYDATRGQVLAAIEHCAFITELNLHPVCLSTRARDYSTSAAYCRQTKYFLGYYAPMNSTVVDSPLRSFYVWFSRNELFDRTRMKCIINDLDFRVCGQMFYDLPVKPGFDFKFRICSFIDMCPREAAFALSNIFYNIDRTHLVLRPTNLARWVASDKILRTECPLRWLDH